MADKVKVYEWVLDGTVYGCGTELEFRYWNNEGVNPEGLQLGGVIGYEPAGKDAKRELAWGIAA